MLIIFCASIGRFQRQEHLREDGLVEAHAYSLLHAVDVEAKLAKLVPQGWEFVLFAYIVGLYNMDIWVIMEKNIKKTILLFQIVMVRQSCTLPNMSFLNIGYYMILSCLGNLSPGMFQWTRIPIHIS